MAAVCLSTGLSKKPTLPILDTCGSPSQAHCLRIYRLLRSLASLFFSDLTDCSYRDSRLAARAVWFWQQRALRYLVECLLPAREHQCCFASTSLLFFSIGYCSRFLTLFVSASQCLKAFSCDLRQDSMPRRRWNELWYWRAQPDIIALSIDVL